MKKIFVAVSFSLITAINSFAQTSKVEYFNFNKPSKHELSFSFKPIFNFGSIKEYSGTYHPFCFKKTFSNYLEISYSKKRNHFVSEIYLGAGLINFSLQFTEKPDSSLILTKGAKYREQFVSDRFFTPALGFRLGRAWKLNNRLEFESLLGITFQMYPNPPHNSGAYIIPMVDSSGNSFDYFRVYGEGTLYLPKFLPQFDLSLKLKYYLTQKFIVSGILNYIDSPFRNDYNINYIIMSLDGKGNIISRGAAYSRLNQLHLGLGLSWSF